MDKKREMRKENKDKRRLSCYKGFFLAEEIYNPESDPPPPFKWTYFSRETDTLPVVKHTIETPTEIILPLNDENIKNGIILFPSEAKEYGTEKELLNEVQGFIHRYVDVEEFFEKISTYYVILSYLYDCFDVVPYLRVIGDFGTGKTRFLKTVGSLCYKPIFCAGAVTPAPIFRFIELYHGTLIIDEADFRFSDGYQDVIKILNSGYTTGSPVLRCEGDEHNPKGYDCFSPKIIGNRNRFRDPALESRCITYEMRERKRDVPINLPLEEFNKKALEIRNKLLLWRLRNYKKRKINNDLIIGGIEDRVNQIMIPLGSIIEDKEVQKEFQMFMVEYNQKLVEDRGITQEAEVSGIICEFLNEGNESPTLKEITTKYSEKYETEHSVKRITPKKVGYIIRSKLKLKTERDRKGYRLISNLEEIGRLKKKYVVASSTP